MMGSKKNECFGSDYDYSFKVLLVGDSGVGKSSLLHSFITTCQQFPCDLAPTIGVDFKIKLLTTGGKSLKLTLWDTAGQERFGMLARRGEAIHLTIVERISLSGKNIPHLYPIDDDSSQL